ncbi:MAG: helix-turn-helix transcriptional regulator, partial [Haloglomus sp.]
ARHRHRQDMRARSRVALQSTLALAVLAAMVVAPAASAAAAASAPARSAHGGVSATAGHDAATLAAQSELPPRDGTALIIRLQADGDARWTVVTTFDLVNESDREAFRDLARRYESGESDIGFGIKTFQQARRAANATVARSMTIREVERGATIVDGSNGTATGRLTLNFTWTNFARTSDGRLRVGSAFNTTSGTWLPGLAAGQTLAIHPPPGYSIFTAPVRPRAGVLRWEGPTSFEPGDLTTIYERNGGPGATPTPTPTNRTVPPTGPSLPGTLLLVGGVGGLLLLGAVLLVLRQRSGDEAIGPAPGAASDDADDSSGAAADDADDTDAPPAAETDDESPGSPPAQAESGAVEEDTALLSDEERVERLLERNGGRMKQANIVSETGWSNAKVSQLLSSMDEDGRIDKLRIGRENLISLPDEDLTGFDEE